MPAEASDHVISNVRTTGMLCRRPKTSAVVTWVISLLAIAAAVVLPMFGTHPLMIVALAAWLVTFGLPTTVAFVATLVWWPGGLTLPGLSGDVSCAVVASAGALVLHLCAYRLSARLSCS